MILCVSVACAGAVAHAGEPAQSAYPEARRFDAAEFYEGLQKRGLTRLLALHLKEHPPADDIKAALLNRDARLAEYADASRSESQRMAAVDEANRLLESLISRHPDDKRARAWRMELGRSLLYTQAERYTSSLLYRGGGVSDRRALRPIMDRAVSVLEALYVDLNSAYEGLDALPASRYDRMEASGAISRLESDLARTDYMLAWARYYRALSRDADDPSREGEFRQVLEYLIDRSNLLDTPHAETHFQAQALLLAGMAYRQVGEYRNCRTMLKRAADAVDGLPRGDERHDLAWVATLARIELVRCHGDSGDYAAAQQAVERFRHRIERTSSDDTGMQLVAGLLERSVYRAAAERAESEGRRSDAQTYRARALRSLALLARRGPDVRAEVYASLYDLLGRDVAPDELDPFERCALVAGALGEADTLGEQLSRLDAEDTDATDPVVVDLEQRRSASLDRVIAIATPMTAPDYLMAADLQPEVRFNLGVALYERGRRLDAARRFLDVARRYPEFERALNAATFCVQLASELHQDASLGSRPEVQALYLDALTTLTDVFPTSAAAKYWQFFLGQHLAALGRFDEAAEAYDKVGAEHDRFYEAKYLAADARSRALKRFAAEHADELEPMNRRATVAIRAASNALEELTQAAADEPDPRRKAELRRLAARANVIAGELYAIPGVSRWTRALDTLKDFETRFAQESALIGRVLRTRMIALESLGRHDEASDLIPRYIASDPAGAAPTLQGLFDAMREEIQRDQAAGLERRARARAESAVVIAEGIYDLATHRPDLLDARATYSVRLQLAETLVQTGDYVRARELFAQCLAEDRARSADGVAHDSRAIYGSAEANYGLARYDQALPLFNRIFRSTQRGSRIWWEALLGDLQCRTALGHDPADIIRSIRQHKFLDHEMGGEHLRKRFDRLLTENERRQEQEQRHSARTPELKDQ